VFTPGLGVGVRVDGTLTMNKKKEAEKDKQQPKVAGGADRFESTMTYRNEHDKGKGKEEIHPLTQEERGSQGLRYR